MHASPIDVRLTTSRHLYLIIIQHLIDHTHEHMEGGNRLQTDVVGCLIHSPRIIKSPNPSLVQDPVLTCLNQDNKTSQTQVTNHTFNFPMIGDDSKSRVSPPHCHIHGYAGVHTHTHAHIFTICSQHTQAKQKRFCRAQWGLESDHRDDFPTSTIL